jgi:hypothetical protein
LGHIGRVSGGRAGFAPLWAALAFFAFFRLVPSGNPHPHPPPPLDPHKHLLEIHTRSLDYGSPQPPLDFHSHLRISTSHSGITQPPPAGTSSACPRRVALRARQCSSWVYHALAIPAKAIAASAVEGWELRDLGAAHLHGSAHLAVRTREGEGGVGAVVCGVVARQPIEQGDPRGGSASRSTGGLWWGGFSYVPGPLNAR